MELKEIIRRVTMLIETEFYFPVIKDELERMGAKFSEPTGTYKVDLGGVAVSNTAGAKNLINAWLGKANTIAARPRDLTYGDDEVVELFDHVDFIFQGNEIEGQITGLDWRRGKVIVRFVDESDCSKKTGLPKTKSKKVAIALCHLVRRDG